MLPTNFTKTQKAEIKRICEYAGVHVPEHYLETLISCLCYVYLNKFTHTQSTTNFLNWLGKMDSADIKIISLGPELRVWVL